MERYAVTGRYMNGNEVTHYHVEVDNGTKRKLTREQFCFLVGKGVVVNCEASLGTDNIQLRGTNGTKLDELPMVRGFSKMEQNRNMAPGAYKVKVSYANDLSKEERETENRMFAAENVIKHTAELLQSKRIRTEINPFGTAKDLTVYLTLKGFNKKAFVVAKVKENTVQVAVKTGEETVMQLDVPYIGTKAEVDKSIKEIAVKLASKTIEAVKGR